MTTHHALLIRAVVAWLPLAVATTLLCGLIYAVLEYDLRSGADDPQIQMAEDAATRLDAGTATGLGRRRYARRSGPECGSVHHHFQ